MRAPDTRQRGAALILLVAIVVLGISWYAVAALGRLAPSDAEREMRTAAALRAGKQALLAYVVQYAARATPADDQETWVPGRMPCPESLVAINTANEGVAAGNCTNGAVEWGRLPWKTLGIELLRDGDGEPLWYVLSPGFRNPAPTFPTPINFGTPGQLPYGGAANAAVALIIAPGKALNTVSDPGTPSAGCSKVNQQANRYATPLAPAMFFECGNASGSYANPGSSPWTNDRVLAVTAAEWSEAIAGPVAERLQRQVAPFLEYWRSTESNAIWSARFLPNASTFTDPATNDLCGDTAVTGVTEGMPPTARSTANCVRWSIPTFTKISGSGSLSGTPTCLTTTALVRCAVSYTGTPTIRVVTTTSVVAGFRARGAGVSDISFASGAANLSNYSLSFGATTGLATLSVDMTPTVAGPTTIDIKHLPEASIMSTDGRIRWFLLNNWDRYTYYAISTAALVGATATCNIPGAPACITVNGLAAGTGNANDKRFVLALMGRKLASQTQPSASPAQYLESHTAPATTTGVPPPFTVAVPSGTYNDRLAMCPFQYTPPSGTPVSICN